MRNILLYGFAAATICIGVHQDAQAAGKKAAVKPVVSGNSYVLTVNPSAKIIASSDDFPACAKVGETPEKTADAFTAVYAKKGEVKVTERKALPENGGVALALDHEVMQVFFARVVDCHQVLQGLKDGGFTVVDPSEDAPAPKDTRA